MEPYLVNDNNAQRIVIVYQIGLKFPKLQIMNYRVSNLYLESKQADVPHESVIIPIKFLLYINYTIDETNHQYTYIVR